MQKEKITIPGTGGDETEKIYANWLYCVPGIGDRTACRIWETCGSARAFYEGGKSLWRKLLTPGQLEAAEIFYRDSDPQGAYEKLQERGIRFVHRHAPDYPERLQSIPDAPFALYVKGKLPGEETASVAVVGARDCSEYGRYVAAELGKTLGERGVQLISGMARGIDGISQRAAIEAGGESFGVLGSGVDVCYPRENRELYDRLCAQGGVLSSYPPGTEARPQNFPPRNRIVSGLADALVVVEARNKSGTLITVDMALEQGREVFAVPGRVTDRLSDGCNQLIRQGAGVFLSPEIFLEEVGMLCPGMAARGQREENAQKGKVPDPEWQEILDALDFQPRSPEMVRERLEREYPIARLTALLMRLCMEELATQVAPGYFARRC